jgi:hypothetical protein
VVRSDRFPSFAEAFEATAKGKELHRVINLKEAQEWLQKNAKLDDVVLYENDLPDLLEKKLKF